MSRLVQSQWTYFRLFISETSDKQRQALLNTITKNQLRALVQIVVNFLQKTITVPSSVIATLTSHKFLYRRLADTSLSLEIKKKALRRRTKAVQDIIRAVEPSLKTYFKK